jgi:hypothetical protein
MESCSLVQVCEAPLAGGLEAYGGKDLNTSNA